MAKTAAGMIKGIGTGLAIGAVAGYVGGKMMMRPKKTKKQADKVMCAMENLVNNVKGMLS